jgi:transcriptional regulator with XRE-family HTH domain
MAKKSDNAQFNKQLESIGDGLRKLRIDRGYSNYHKLAYDMEMTHSQYGAYENGKNITINTLLRILNFHQLSLKEFVCNYVNFE